MSSLYASRWAATPPPDKADELNGNEAVNRDAQGHDPQRTPVAAKDDRSVEAATTPPLEAPDDDNKLLSAPRVGVEGEDEAEHAEVGADPANVRTKDLEAAQASEQAVSEIARYPDTSRLEPPRSKRRVSWRGKTCVISIPNVDFKASRRPMPLTPSEAQERPMQFDEAAYDTRGFDLAHNVGPEAMLAHARPIYPNESEVSLQARERRPKVLLPDLNRLKAEADRLIEQRLAALGVSISGDEPPLPPAPSRPPVQDVPRQSSGQYPPLPFSPPLPTGSGASMGRPPTMRGHSHTMSVASPISPGIGPFGHMHRHSTFSGPSGFPQIRTQQLPQQTQQPPIAGNQAFSPQTPFPMAGFAHGGSPAQLAALRQDLGPLRGPGSPPNQQMFAAQSPQHYSRGLMQDQRHRQHAYSHSVQHQPVQSAFITQMPSVNQTPALPELPEEDDEGELQEPAPEPPVPEPEPPAYVPPHKGAQVNTDVAVPTPTRSHQHNISDGLERDILEAELRHEVERQNWIEVIESGEESAPAIGDTHQCQADLVKETESTNEDLPAQTVPHQHKKSASRFNVAAPAFNFNPAASFEPSNTAFNFGMPASEPSDGLRSGDTRQISSGAFNVAASALKPSNPLSMPKSDFSFSSQGPSFKPDASAFEPTKLESKGHSTVDDLPSVFGKVNIPSIVTPARRSKAIAIVPPEEAARKLAESSEEFEDDEGRVAQSDDRLKRQGFGGDDGDEVPRLAEPSPMPDPADFAVKAPSHPVGIKLQETDPEAVIAEAGESLENVADAGDDDAEHAADRADVPQQSSGSTPSKPAHGHKPSSSLSALARPFQPPTTLEPSISDRGKEAYGRFASVSDLEEGEILEDATPAVSPVRDQQSPLQLKLALSEPHLPFDYPTSERIGQVAHPEPSFDEIDAVMRQLNETEVSEAREIEGERALSPLPDFDEQPIPRVTFLPEWSRSDAPSPGPRRRLALHQATADSSFTVHDRTDSGGHVLNGWPNVTRLNKAEEVPMSDWSGVLSPPDEEKLQHRSAFFDSHIDNLIGKVVERRLLPLEESLRSIQHTVVKRSRSTDRPFLKRTSSTAESDADDEDELSDEQVHRPFSRGRDKRIDQIKLAVIEALREQSPRRSQSSYDIADLHSALADMKVSFARAASASLDLEDVRAVVEDALHRQGQALVPLATAESTQAHKREMSELEGKWQETLAGALEEANHRRHVEERAAETQRLLRLAEEEVILLRDSSRDEDGRFASMEEERRELLERCKQAEEAQQRAEEHGRDLEAENEALQATLEEYRASSSKWRHDVDDGQREREDLEGTITGLERQIEEAQESSSGMRRRLEKLHAHVATAAGQLAREKATAKAKEDDYRDRCDSLELQQATQARQRHELEEELRVLRGAQAEAHDARLALDATRASNGSLEELVRKLQADLAEQQALAVRYERDFHDARETGRAEVHRTRMALETDVEAANHRVNVVRAELDSELTKMRVELEYAKLEADTAKARHERLLEEEDNARREALRKINHASSVALDEARQKHGTDMQELTSRHQRMLQHAFEDKERSEYILNERLALSDANLQHSHDRILHLEETLEIAKSAAQAAAMSAQSRTAPVAAKASTLPEKVSPQALRESILVLQEQLRDREARIERLQVPVDKEGPAKLKERDSEITWLRELLAVRSEDLTDLVNTLAQPTFERDAVRDTAIRIRANLQMEQQEKERFGYAPQSLGGQALATLSSFATPKASSLTSAFNKWRTTMESTSLRTAPRSGQDVRSTTPSKPAAKSTYPPNHMVGLMTPPASNLRQTPSPEAAASLQHPRLQAGAASKPRPRDTSAGAPSHGRRSSNAFEGPTTPLFCEQSYDQDAEDNKVHMQSFEDDDLDVADSAPPAFRSLEDELAPSAVDQS